MSYRGLVTRLLGTWISMAAVGGVIAGAPASGRAAAAASQAPAGFLGVVKQSLAGDAYDRARWHELGLRRFLLSETPKFSQALDLTVRTPTGSNRTGQGIGAVSPIYNFWWNAVGGLVLRGGVEVPAANPQPFDYQVLATLLEAWWPVPHRSMWPGVGPRQLQDIQCVTVAGSRSEGPPSAGGLVMLCWDGLAADHAPPPMGGPLVPWG